jgi:hypothetical protein
MLDKSKNIFIKTHDKISVNELFFLINKITKQILPKLKFINCHNVKPQFIGYINQNNILKKQEHTGLLFYLPCPNNYVIEIIAKPLSTETIKTPFILNPKVNITLNNKQLSFKPSNIIDQEIKHILKDIGSDEQIIVSIWDDDVSESINKHHTFKNLVDGLLFIFELFVAIKYAEENKLNINITPDMIHKLKCKHFKYYVVKNENNKGDFDSKQSIVAVIILFLNYAGLKMNTQKNDNIFSKQYLSNKTNFFKDPLNITNNIPLIDFLNQNIKSQTGGGRHSIDNMLYNIAKLIILEDPHALKEFLYIYLHMSKKKNIQFQIPLSIINIIKDLKNVENQIRISPK